MAFYQYKEVIFFGFVVCWSLAPSISRPRFAELLLAYLSAMLVLLLATGEILTSYPVPFYFMVGGALALVYFFLDTILDS